MANINLNISELNTLLDVMPASHNLMLVGEKGVGKSEILTSYFNGKGMKVVPLFLGQMSDPGDLIGLPSKDESTGRTGFMPPYWFPVDGKPIVLFLDELNRARPEVLQTVFDLCLNRKLAGRNLPEGSRVISAVNAGDQYQVTDLDPALVSRFNIVNFKPTAQEWLLWAERSRLDKRVIRFITENPAWLDGDADLPSGTDTGLDKNPDRRAWKRVSDMLEKSEGLEKTALAKILSSVIGAHAASVFIESFSSDKLPSAEDVLMHLEKVLPVLDRYELHQLSAINGSLFRYLETSDIPEKKQQQMGRNLEAYFNHFAGCRKEVAAHFANNYVEGMYPGAFSFISKNCPGLIKAIITYIKDI